MYILATTQEFFFFLKKRKKEKKISLNYNIVAILKNIGRFDQDSKNHRISFYHGLLKRKLNKVHKTQKKEEVMNT